MFEILVKHDPREIEELKARIQASIRRIGGGSFAKDLERLLIEENEYHAMRGLNRRGERMNPWKARRGRSDYHGRDYGVYTNATVLIPFGRASRRISAFRAEVSRRSIAGVGIGEVRVSAGFDPRARLVPHYWGAKDPTRDVLGIPPRTTRAVRLLCYRHANFAHAALRKGSARIAASLLG